LRRTCLLHLAESDLWFAFCEMSETKAMTTTPLVASPASTPASTAKSSSNPYNLGTGDFVKMMITQLQHQDPLQPESNDQLMSQMNQIGQLQSNSMLQDTLKSLSQQTQIGSASNLIGKMVQGTDQNNNAIHGVVNSVKLQSDGVSLELDNGQSLSLARVTAISPPPGPATAGQ